MGFFEWFGGNFNSVVLYTGMIIIAVVLANFLANAPPVFFKAFFIIVAVAFLLLIAKLLFEIIEEARTK